MFGPYTRGSDHPGYDDMGPTPVTLPHCVTELSWQKWDPATWEHVWVYRRTFDGTNLLNFRGRRVGRGLAEARFLAGLGGYRTHLTA